MTNSYIHARHLTHASLNELLMRITSKDPMVNQVFYHKTSNVKRAAYNKNV